MSIIALDGFGGYGSSDLANIEMAITARARCWNLLQIGSYSDLAMRLTTGPDGGRAIRFLAAHKQGVALQWSVTTNSNYWIVGFWYKYTVGIKEFGLEVGRGAGTAGKFYFSYSAPNARVILYAASQQATANLPYNVFDGSWHELAFYVPVASATDAELYVDGVLTTQTWSGNWAANPNWAQGAVVTGVENWDQNTDQTFEIASFYILNHALIDGNDINTYPTGGGMKVVTKLPTAVGNNNSMTLYGGGTKQDAMKDSNDNTYVQGTVGQTQSFDLADAGTVLYDSIKGVLVVAKARYNTIQEDLQLQFNNVDFGAIQTVASVPTYFSRFSHLHPGTSAPFTLSNVNDELGLSVE